MFFLPLPNRSSHAFFLIRPSTTFCNKRNLMARVESHKVVETLRGNRVLLIIKPQEVRGTRFMHLERKKG